jgi:hypothetical protein
MTSYTIVGSPTSLCSFLFLFFFSFSGELGGGVKGFKGVNGQERESTVQKGQRRRTCGVSSTLEPTSFFTRKTKNAADSSFLPLPEEPRLASYFGEKWKNPEDSKTPNSSEKTLFGAFSSFLDSLFGGSKKTQKETQNSQNSPFGRLQRQRRAIVCDSVGDCPPVECYSAQCNGVTCTCVILPLLSLYLPLFSLYSPSILSS